jgi:hypothetical protein
MFGIYVAPLKAKMSTYLYLKSQKQRCLVIYFHTIPPNFCYILDGFGKRKKIKSFMNILCFFYFPPPPFLFIESRKIWATLVTMEQDMVKIRKCG